MKNPLLGLLVLLLSPIYMTGLGPLVLLVWLDTGIKFGFRQVGKAIDYLPLPEPDYHGNLIDMVDSPIEEHRGHFQTIERYLISQNDNPAVQVNGYLAKAALYQNQLDNPVTLPEEYKKYKESAIKGVIEDKGRLIEKAQSHSLNDTCTHKVNRLDENSSINVIVETMQVCREK
ncbi:hypothetical protein [Crocosphaera chwakensis]|uniref:Uncharacterized protein n=1 Tax=Crocosphaera chwakensis CCY0110 TaxID=391612 RepID=A3IX99_9CHRO|nr:hypothetical protein [Crocosphaera chwakensis]EAZ88892.1 hypothetical protein CY0110_31870 [Crocosphaera chwakensis CCY0110]